VLGLLERWLGNPFFVWLLIVYPISPRLATPEKPPVRLTQVAFIFGRRCGGRDVVQPTGITKTTHGRLTTLSLSFYKA